MNYWLLLLPILSAAAGWLTIRLATWFLFNPLLPQRFFGIKVQGILPRSQERIAVMAGKFVAGEFPFAGDIARKINDPDNFERIKPLVEAHMEDFLRNRLKDQMPMISMFIGDRTIDSLKIIFIKEIETLFPQVMNEYAAGLQGKQHVEELVQQKIRCLSPNKVREVLYSGMTREFRLASAFGAVIGLVTGILQLILILVTN